MIEYVVIVGTEAANECECRELLRGYEAEGCGAAVGKYIRVDGVLLCVKCAVKAWKRERGERVLGDEE